MYNPETHDLVITSYPGCSGKIRESPCGKHLIDFYSDGKVLKYFDRSTDKIEIIDHDNCCLYYDNNYRICMIANEYLENMNNIDLFITYMTKSYSHSVLSSYLKGKESRRLFEDLELNKQVIFEHQLHYIHQDEINELILLYKNKAFKLSGYYFVEFTKMKNSFAYSQRTKEEAEEHKKKLLDYFLINSVSYIKKH